MNTAIRDSNLLTFVNQQIKTRGIKSIGRHTLAKALEAIDNALLNCCFAQQPTRINTFLSTFFLLFRDMDKLHDRVKLRRVQKALLKELECCNCVRDGNGRCVLDANGIPVLL